MQDIILDNTWIIEATKEIHNNNGNNNSYMIKILRIQYDYIDIIQNIKNTIWLYRHNKNVAVWMIKCQKDSQE